MGPPGKTQLQRLESSTQPPRSIPGESVKCYLEKMSKISVKKNKFDTVQDVIIVYM